MSNVSIDFGPVMREIARVGDGLGREINAVSVSVGEARNDIAVTSRDLQQLRTRFEEYVQRAEQIANVQRAETKLSGLKDDLEREFGHYNVVRRTSIGILQAFDIGNVTNATVSQISEELMIQTPRYWLAPALVALAGWSRADEEMMNISVTEAFRRDPRKTALFFALVLRRQGRLESSVRWLRQYLLSLDPMQLSREFVIVLECVTLGAFGPQGIAMASEKIREWNEELRSDQDVVEAQIEEWRAFVATHRQQLSGAEFPVLRQTSPQWGQVAGLLESASALPVAIEWFERVRDTTENRSNVAEDVLDDILERLVTEFDEEELPLRREIAYNQSVIGEDGDLDRARARADVVQASLGETLDAVSLQTAAAMYPGNLGVGVGTQQVAIGTSRDEATSGVGRFTFDYRSRLLSAIQISLSPNHSGYSATLGFPGWTTSTDVAENAAIAELTHTWETTVAARREQLKFRGSKLVVPGIISAVVLLIAFLINPIAGIIVLLGAGALLYFLHSNGKKKADAAIAELERTKEAALQESIRVYRAATAEFVDAGVLFQELDGQEVELLDVIRTWPVGYSVSEGVGR